MIRANRQTAASHSTRWVTAASVALIVGLYAVSIIVFYVLIVWGLTLLAVWLTKEDTDIVDTRIATATMKAFVFKEVGETNIVKE